MIRRAFAWSDRASPRPTSTITRRIAGRIGVIGCLFWLTLGCSNEDDPATTSPAEPAKASLLLVSIDTTRADRIGAYGRPNAGTPNLDSVASLGVFFASARTAAPLTLPAHASILTGLYPATHGIHDNGIASLAPEADTLAEAAKHHGMETGAFVGAFVLSSRFGLSQGFDHWSEPKDYGVMNGSLLAERPANQVVDDAVEWIGQTESRFFTWVHLFDPHHPYEPPEPHATAHADDPYQGEIAFVDSQVGRLIDAARARDPELLIAIVSDHGEGLGEHGEKTHGPFVYDSTMRIPFLLAGPGVPPNGPIHDAVSTVDLDPTVRDLLGLRASPHSDGQSLTSVFTGKPLTRRTPVSLESYWGYLHQRWSPIIAVTDGSRKFILAPREEMLDLVRDPKETTNFLESSPASEVEPLRTAARNYHQGEGRFATAYSTTQADRRFLAELGYLTGGSLDGALPPPSSERKDPKDGVHLLPLRDEAIDAMNQFDASAPPDVALIERTIERLEQALQEDPENPSLSEIMGFCRFRIGQYEEALKFLSVGLAANPSSADTRYAIALCLAGLQRRTEAIEQFNKVLETVPDMAMAHSFIGTLYMAEGRDEDALPHFEHFLRVWPNPNDQTASRMQVAIKLMKDRIAKAAAADG